MTTYCLIEVEGVENALRRPWAFVALPRIGETVSLEPSSDHYSGHVVYDVRHVPSGIEEGRSEYTVLYLRKVPIG